MNSQNVKFRLDEFKNLPYFEDKTELLVNYQKSEKCLWLGTGQVG